MTDTQTRRSRQLTGAREIMLIEELAVGDTRYEELAEKYEVEEKTVRNFAHRNRARIDAAAREQADHLQSMWIARKELRIAQYQAEADRNIKMIEDIQAAVADISDSTGIPVSPDTSKIAQLQAVIFRAMDMVAVETGQRTEAQHQGKRYRYEIDVPGWEDAA